MAANTRLIRLLLVDDEEEFLRATSLALGRRGFEVSVAPNGVTALEMVAVEEYDIVVLDVKMPDISGTEVFGRIRSHHPSLPVILLTGHPSTADAFHTSKQGIACYLAKPVDIEELANTAKRAVGDVRKETRQGDASVEGGNETGISVMIVDDETDLLNSLQRVFERRKFKTYTADSGAKAFDELQRVLVDVMVLDVKMPGMNGLEVLKLVRERYPSIQVILLSGHPSVEAALEGVHLGASEYLKKPPDIEELVGTIRRLYRQRQELLEDQRRTLIEEIRRRYVD